MKASQTFDYASLRQIFRRRLSTQYRPEEADRLFFIIIENVCGLPPHAYFAGGRNDHVRPECMEALNRLERGEPWQYILGETEFAGLKLKVDRRVLIPRPETEELALKIREVYRSKQPPFRILDAGTGSGALALALKSFFPSARVTGTDVSLAALEVARENAEQNGLDVNWVKGDMLRGEFPPGPFDLIVSNPPYVPESERADMAPRVRDYEPPEALFVPDEDPLVFYRALIEYFKAAASPNGRMFAEIHHAYGPALLSLADQYGLKARIDGDLAGKDRFFEVWHP
ncbi:MAG: peptide chain release factor N(5)-glutamine methyltransferase [Chlorobi bacterium]|nr:peptide chain release factor N(5)-glutamine methyltransferase [Chlorobiota bacterium]